MREWDGEWWEEGKVERCGVGKKSCARGRGQERLRGRGRGRGRGRKSKRSHNVHLLTY